MLRLLDNILEFFMLNFVIYCCIKIVLLANTLTKKSLYDNIHNFDYMQVKVVEKNR